MVIFRISYGNAGKTLDLDNFFPRPGNVGKLEVPSQSEVLQMAADIADGMAYLQSRKIIHRFKRNNLLEACETNQTLL